MSKGTSSTEEGTALLSRSVTMRHALRPAIGTEDGLYIEGTLGFHRPPGLLVPRQLLSLYVSGRVEAEGAVVASRSLWGYGYSLGGWETIPHEHYTVPFHVPKHALAPGRHELRVITQLQLGGTVCEKETRTSVEVVPGSIAARTVRLVRGSVPTLEIETGRGRLGWPFRPMVSYERLRHALAMDVEVFEGETSIGRGVLIAPGGATGSRSIESPGHDSAAVSKPLPSGHHVLRFRFTPDAALAFESDVECTEIYGEPVEKELAIDVP